ESIESYTGVPVLGGFLREPKIQIPERHLGLKTAEENIEFHACLDSLLQLTKKDTQQPGIDLERILKIAQDTSSFPLFPSSFPRKRESRKDISGLDSRFRGNDGGRSRNDGGRDGNNDGGRDNVTKPVRIGIAMDKAFSFYYQANLDILTELGAELAPFSPTKDENLPEDCSALYFGGGFPELYAKELEENHSLKNQIKESVRAGLPIYAECGGLMFLSESLETLDGATFSMAGVVPGKVTMTKNLQNFGYKEGNAVCDTLMSEKGENVRGHEFHYSKRSIPTSKDASAYELTHRRTGERQLEGYSNDSVLATYLHIHFLTNPNWAKRFFENAVRPDFCIRK
ncbi:MAG: cobyrinate a,c-diamide synthase, partial [Elusimicrobia bacterium]|nr:cobyrinate a,c-diamide synthase [Elusimicrobiota bacterium]